MNFPKTPQECEIQLAMHILNMLSKLEFATTLNENKVHQKITIFHLLPIIVGCCEVSVIPRDEQEHLCSVCSPQSADSVTATSQSQ